MALVVKNLPAKAGDVRDVGLIPGSERYPGEGHDNSLHYSCLENPMDRGAWSPMVHGITKSQAQLKRPSTQMHDTYFGGNPINKRVKLKSECALKESKGIDQGSKPQLLQGFINQGSVADNSNHGS